MQIFHAIVLGIVEGITEFLPISSTGHLTIVESLLGYKTDSPAITAFTAVVQIGAIAAAVWYFRSDILRVATAWVAGVMSPLKRRNTDYRMGWYVIIGTVPVAVVGLLFKHTIESSLRGLTVVALGLILWSFVLLWADKKATEQRQEVSLRWQDALFIGMMQCVSLIPGVSRSGATIAAGLLRGIDRVTATRMSFFLGIPALLAAGTLQAFTQVKNISEHVGWGSMIVGIVAAYVVGYLSIAWLIRFVSHHDFTVFVWYRIGLGLLILLLVAGGVMG